MRQGTYLKIPQTGDRGTVFCPAVSDSLDTLDIHDHDGVNSKKISSKSISRAEINLVATDWVLDANGDYKQTITLPSGYETNTTYLKFFINSGANTGKEIYPTVNKFSTTKFDVYVYTNTFDLKVVLL